MKFALNDKAKGVSGFMIIGRWIFEFHFYSYAWMSLTCSRSFPHGIASGGLPLYYTYWAYIESIDL